MRGHHGSRAPCDVCRFFFFSSYRPVACYSSASLHLFISRPRLLFPSRIPSCTFLTSRSSATLDMCMLHSVLLLCTRDVMFCIPHVSRILSFLILFLLVLFIIFLSVFISVTSNICIVFANSQSLPINPTSIVVKTCDDKHFRISVTFEPQ